MATLDVSYALVDGDVDASSVTGLRPMGVEGVVATTPRRVFVVDVNARRVTRDFVPPEELRFTCPAFAVADDDGEFFLRCAVGDHLWSWRLDAADLKSGVEKMPLPFEPVEAAPLATARSGVVIVASDGRCSLIAKDGSVTSVDDDSAAAAAAATTTQDAFATSSLDERVASLAYSAEGAATYCRLFDFVRKKARVKNILLPNCESKKEDGNSYSLVLRRNNSLCLVGGGKVKEFRLPKNREKDEIDVVAEELREVILEKDVGIAWIHPEKGFFFCFNPSSRVLEMRSLKFGTTLASQPFVGTDSTFDLSENAATMKDAVCCLIDSSFCIVDGKSISVYPFAFPDESSSLSANFGKKKSFLHLESAQESENGSWCRKRGRVDAHYAAATSTLGLAEFSASLSPSTPDWGSLIKRLDLNWNKISKMEFGKFFEAVTGKLAKSSDAFSPTAEIVFRALMENSIVNKWEPVIDLLLARSNLSILSFALRQPGIDAANLCRLLRHVTSLSDEAFDSLTSSGAASPTRHLLLIQIVSHPLREEDARKTLKTFSAAEVVVMIESLSNLLKGEERTTLSTSLAGAALEEESSSTTSLAPSFPHSLLNWITLLVDSHYLNFVLGDDERHFQILADLEAFTRDLESYFETKEALDGLLGSMNDRRRILGDGGVAIKKTSMDPEDEYCIQVIKF